MYISCCFVVRIAPASKQHESRLASMALQDGSWAREHSRVVRSRAVVLLLAFFLLHCASLSRAKREDTAFLRQEIPHRPCMLLPLSERAVRDDTLVVLCRLA